MIACIIPARYNSSRFPGKLLAQARGKSVIQRTWELGCQCVDPKDLFVATDDERIASLIEGLGGQVIWTSVDCLNGTDRIAQAVSKTKELQKAEIIVNLQGDHPCTDPETVKKTIHALKKDPTAVMSTAATPLSSIADFHSPHIVKVVVDQNGSALYFSRSPIPYGKEKVPAGALQHIGLYCFRRSFLLEFASFAHTPLQLQEDLEQLRVLEKGYKINVAIAAEASIGVDTPQDLAKLEEFLCR